MKEPEDLKPRTKRFALDIIRFVEALPKNYTCTTLGRQLLRAGTSVGANYRAARRGRSPADFINKMSVVEEEADECCYWLELLIDDGKVIRERAQRLLDEASQLLAISVASVNTARRSGRSSSPGRPEKR